MSKVEQKRPRQSRKSPEQQTRVIAKKMAGKSDAQIAREEGIARNTVGSILNASHYQDAIRRYREELLELIPDSITHYRKVLRALYGKATANRPIKEGETVGAGAARIREQRAFQAWVAAGVDATKVAGDVLHGTQVFVTKLEQATTVYDGTTKQFTDDELRQQISERLTRLAEKSGPADA